MSVNALKNNDSYIALKNRICIIKLKRIIDNSSFEQKFKNDIYDLLLNNYLGSCELDMSCYCDVIEKTILDSSVDSQDIRLFEKRIVSNIDNYYNHFKISTESIDDLPRKHGAYCFYKYIKRSERTYGEFDSDNSQRIWEFKKKQRHEDIRFYTEVLMKEIAYLSKKIINDDIETLAIFRVPSSKPWRNSVMDKCIELIKENYQNGILECEYGCNKKILNCSDFLSRIDEVPTFSEEGHGIISEEEYNDSMSCSTFYASIFDSKTVLILLDDIVTTGFSMSSCYKKLNESFPDKAIYKVAIAGSTWRRY